MTTATAAKSSSTAGSAATRGARIERRQQQGYFTSEPSDTTLVAWMRKEWTETLKTFTGMWKRQHGHGD